MVELIIVAVVVAPILFLAEYLSRYKGLHAELSRKLVHISVGTFAAFWPFFLSWRQIQLLSLIFLVGMIASVKFHLIPSIHGVSRSTMGEILSVVAIGSLAIITPDAWVFMVAMLHLSLADGIAAIVGLLWGDDNKYKVFGHYKSVAGSLGFFFCSVGIMLCYAAFSGSDYSAVTVLWLPVIATVIENMAVHGADNLMIPLFVALVLSSSL